MTPRHVRALRGTGAAWIATVAAATAHTLAGGGAPSPAFVAAVGILAAPFAVLLVGRRLSAWRVAATVLASQTLFHAAFAITADADVDGVRRVGSRGPRPSGGDRGRRHDRLDRRAAGRRLRRGVRHHPLLAR